jgi:hypothetical protein
MKKLLIALATTIALVGPAAHATDLCKGPDYGTCRSSKGKVCYKFGRCCKNSHDWATEIRDETICKREKTK